MHYDSGQGLARRYNRGTVGFIPTGKGPAIGGTIRFDLIKGAAPMTDIIEEAVEEVADAVHKATDPNQRRRSAIWVIAIALLAGNTGLSGFDTFFTQDKTTKQEFLEVKSAAESTRDSVAILSGVVSKHIEVADESLDDFMDQLVHMEITQARARLEDQVAGFIDKRDEWIREAQAELDNLDFSEFRRRSENTFTAELLQRYNMERGDLRNEIADWQEEIRLEQRKLH